MDFNLKLSSLSPSSLYITEFLSPKSSLHKLTLHSSPVFGRCISEIKISSEKSSPLPTPISLNFSKPRTPTSVSKPSFFLKKLEKPETKVQKKETNSKAKTLKLKKKKPEKKKNESKKETEAKIEPEKEKTKKIIEKNKLIKELGYSIRKMNLKFSKKRFVQKAKWGSNTEKVLKLSILEKDPEIPKKPSRAKLPKPPKPAKPKKPRKPLKTPKYKPSPAISRDEPKVSKKDLISKVTKIQALFRGHLVRKRFKDLKNPIYSIDFSHPISPLHSSSTSHIEADNEVLNILTSKLKSSASHVSATLSPSVPLTDRSKPVSSLQTSRAQLISAEISLKLKQTAKLRELQQMDMQEMRAIAEKFNNKTEIIELFSNFIARRYEKLTVFFEKSIKKLQQKLLSVDNTEDLENIENFLITEKLKRPSEFGFEIESILQEIEKIEEDQANSFLHDPQPLPPLTPIIEERKKELKIVDEFDYLTKECLDHQEVSQELLHDHKKPELPSFSVIFTSIQPNFQSEPLMCESKSRVLVDFPASTTNLLENSEGIKDLSSIAQLPKAETTEITSLGKLEVSKVSQLRRTVWPSSKPTFAEPESPSNPLMTTEEREINSSEEELILDRVLASIEAYVFYDLLELAESLFENADFLVRLSEDLLFKYLDEFIAETLKPKIVRQPTKTYVSSDSLNLLTGIDQEFLKCIKSPETLKSKIKQQIDPLIMLKNVRKNRKIDFLESNCFEITKTSDSNKYSFIHDKAIYTACSQSFFSLILQLKLCNFDFCIDHLNKLNLQDFFISVRETVYKWNELKAGNMPSDELLSPSGELDEDKLQAIRTQSLAKLLYQDLEEDDLKWCDYNFEEEQSIMELEVLILQDLVFEVLPLFNNI